MKTPFDRARPLEVTVKWRTGVRTPEWERLWQRIISTLMQENWTADQDTANEHRGQVRPPARSMMAANHIEEIRTALESMLAEGGQSEHSDGCV